MKNPRISRRQFLRRAGTAAVAFPCVVGANALGRGGRPVPSDRIVMAGIGMGGRGSGVLGQFMGDAGVQVVAVCDVYGPHLQKGVERSCNEAVKTYVDYQDLLTDSSVSIGSEFPGKESALCK